MIPPLFLQPPVDKSFSFIAQTQGLQVHRPQKGEKEAGGWGWWGGVVLRGWRAGGADGKENGQSGDKRGRNRAPLPWFNLYTHPSYPWPLPPPGVCSCTPGAPLCFAQTALPHVTGVQTASGAAWCYQAFLGVCGRGQGAGVAEGPCGGSSPLFFWTSRGAVMSRSYSCAHWALPYLGLQWPLNLISPCRLRFWLQLPLAEGADCFFLKGWRLALLQNDKCLVLFKPKIYSDIKQKNSVNYAAFVIFEGGQQVNQSQSVGDVWGNKVTAEDISRVNIRHFS